MQPTVPLGSRSEHCYTTDTHSGGLALKTVLVTGCSSGLGAATATTLGQRGHRVFATARNVASLSALVEGSPGPITAHALDVCDPSSIGRLHDEILDATGGVGPDIVVNNAGIGAYGPVELTPLSVARSCFETNVLGLLAVTQAFLPLMRQRRAGHIINISSVVGRIVMPYEGAYVASKHAVEGLSDALRFEVAPFGIYVTVIEPGALRTNFESRGADQMDALSLDGTPYVDHVKGFVDQRAKAFAKAPDGTKAAKVIVRAIEARRPPTRVMFPGQARFISIAFGTFSDRTTDAIKRRAFRVPRREPARSPS
jgi:NAD(P)-dependent dehydrogenase (short-subunit alcohol dehydrogenase family)